MAAAPTATTPEPEIAQTVLRGDAGSVLGNSWRMQFMDVDGIMLNMQSFEEIDFGAISYKEIFQNVKTILSTPLFSAALERTLGVDQRIVDLPMTMAAEATIAILDALCYWEPRVEVIKIAFSSDVLNARLTPNLQLKIRNVIYGTDTTYEKTNITQEAVVQTFLEGEKGEKGDKGDTGATGPRGSAWFFGTVDPDVTPPDPQPEPIGAAKAGDVFCNTDSGDIFFLESQAPVTQQRLVWTRKIRRSR